MLERDLAIDARWTYGDLRRYANTLDVTVCSENLRTGLNGIYDETTRTIIVDRTMSYTQKRCTLVHELIHWAHHDTECSATRKAKSETRTRRLTANTLIPEWEAEMLGEEYGGDPNLIANELNVTVSVLEDYMHLILEQGHHQNMCATFQPELGTLCF